MRSDKAAVCFLNRDKILISKSKTVIAIYVYACESSRFTLLENGIGYYAMIKSLEEFSVSS